MLREAVRPIIVLLFAAPGRGPSPGLDVATSRARLGASIGLPNDAAAERPPLRKDVQVFQEPRPISLPYCIRK
jgi:hypothetical protein